MSRKSSSTTCSTCGKQVSTANNFCEWCGSNLTGGWSRVCPQCGSHVPDGDKYCLHCGAQLSGSRWPSPKPAKPSSAPTPPTPPAPHVPSPPPAPLVDSNTNPDFIDKFHELNSYSLGTILDAVREAKRLCKMQVFEDGNESRLKSALQDLLAPHDAEKRLAVLLVARRLIRALRSKDSSAPQKIKNVLTANGLEGAEADKFVKTLSGVIR